MKAFWRNLYEAAELVLALIIGLFGMAFALLAMVLMMATPFIAIGLGIGVIVWVVRAVTGI